MANQEHFNVLKQGVDAWNKWRRNSPIDPWPDLSRADLKGIDLSRGNLVEVSLGWADLRKADLSKCDLFDAGLAGANLSGANLARADLTRAGLAGANLRGANLTGANLNQALLREVDLSGADLRWSNLSEANLEGANLSESTIGSTVFGRIDLSVVKGIDSVIHTRPSIIGIDTIYLSHGKISDVFLQRAGVPDSFITYSHTLVSHPIDYYACFISYSSQDKIFAKQLYADLQSKGVRCWFAPEDLKIGDHYHQRIDESIRLYDKLILILSEHAVQSSWVEREAVAAREKEDQLGHEVLFPIRLDDAVMQTTKAWAADVRRRWHIGDFTQWKDHDTYKQAFERLLRDLKAAAHR